MTSIRPIANVLFQNQGITLISTGRDYDFSHTLENENDYPVRIHLTGKYEYMVEETVIPAHDWVGLFAGYTGPVTEAAFEEGKFVIKCYDEEAEVV